MNDTHPQSASAETEADTQANPFARLYDALSALVPLLYDAVVEPDHDRRKMYESCCLCLIRETAEACRVVLDQADAEHQAILSRVHQEGDRRLAETP